MRKILGYFFISLAIVGCSSKAPFQNDTWKAVAQGDEFSDSLNLIVTTGDYSSGGYVVTRGMRYYPVIGRNGNDIYFGVMSGGRFKIPVGNIQVRIDQNKTWDISSSETPEVLVSKINSFQAIDYGLKGEQAEVVRHAQEQAMENYGRAMSHITAVGGEKARQIIRQMLSGKRIIYRSTMTSTPTSTTGKADLDSSLRKSLVEIGIDPSSI